MRVTVRDVTLREYGQTLSASSLDVFTPSTRAWLAGELIDAGIRTFEVASTASARVAPAMAVEEVRPFVEAVGTPDHVDLVTLVPPSMRAFERFLDLGLGPDGLGHVLGIFLSAMDEHNVANLGRPVEDSLAALVEVVRKARLEGIRCVGYVSAAFGFETDDGRLVSVDDDGVARLVEAQAAAGVESVTLSDLQGIAPPERTFELVAKLYADPRTAGVTLGYHAHHLSPDAGLDNAVAAARAGAVVFDGSLGAVGGCVTGAPGNVPTEGLLARLEADGFETGLDAGRLASLAREVARRLYEPLATASRDS